MYEIEPAWVSSEGFIYSPRKIAKNIFEISRYVDRWNPSMFETPFDPIKIGRGKGIVKKRVVDMPIKFPGSNECRIPKEFSNILPEIQHIMDFEISNNPMIDQYHAYLTTDYMFCNAGITHRKGGCHVDGYQGVRTTKNELINRSYVYSSIYPTEFFLQSFPIKHVDDSKYNVFKYMDKIANEEYIWRALRPFDIVLMNVYNVHRSPIIKEKGFRFFFRLTFDVRQFDRLGNTHNPMFQYKWNMVKRDVQSTLLNYE